jgi:hypothetical protein
VTKNRALLPLISILSEVLPIIFYLCFLKRNRGQGLWVIFVYCIISVLTETVIAGLSQKVDNFYLYACFTILEYTIITLFFFLSFKEKKFKFVPVVGSVIFLVMATVNFTYKKSETFDSLSATVEAILIIIYCILFLYEQIKDPSIVFVYDTKKFWVVIALFIYFSSTLFLFLYATTLTKQQNSNYWDINNFFDIIKNILFCIAFIKKKDSKKEYPLENLYSDV